MTQAASICQRHLVHFRAHRTKHREQPRGTYYVHDNPKLDVPPLVSFTGPAPSLYLEWPKQRKRSTSQRTQAVLPS